MTAQFPGIYDMIWLYAMTYLNAFLTHILDLKVTEYIFLSK